MKVIFNGELLEDAQAPCSATGWLNGTGIFETIKTVNGAPYSLNRHIIRAQKSAQELEIIIPESAKIKEAVANLLLSTPQVNGLLRISFSSQGGWLAAHLPYVVSTRELAVRIHAQPLAADAHKKFPYTSRLEIQSQAHDAGFDDAITINADGNICEGSVSNLLVKIDNQWLTPPVSDGVLPGIMRAILVESNKVQVQSIALSQVSKISSAFFLSSLRIAQEISSIEANKLQPSHGFSEEIHALAQKYSID